MKPTALRLFPLLLLAMGMLACGGGGSDDPPNGEPELPPPSGLSTRVFLTNDHPTGPAVEIMDGAEDFFFGRIGMVARPSLLTLTPDGRFTLVYHEGSNIIVLVDNNTETAVGSITLPDWTESLVAPANRIVYAAVRGIGAVAVWDMENGTLDQIPVPTVRRLVKNASGSKVLAFSDDSDALTVIDTATRATTVVGGFDRPVWGVFNADGSTAFILSCGPQCGGSAAGVTELHMGDLTLGAHAAVSAATTALLDGSRLYVAGSTPGGGLLDVVDTAAMSVSASGIAIGDGFHHRMALGSNGKLFIAALACNNVASGCLTIFNTAAQTARIGTPKGQVTGLQPISGRNVVYVAEGGELRIYDTTTDAEQSRQLEFPGRIVDVKQIN